MNTKTAKFIENEMEYVYLSLCAFEGKLEQRNELAVADDIFKRFFNEGLEELIEKVAQVVAVANLIAEGEEV